MFRLSIFTLLFVCMSMSVSTVIAQEDVGNGATLKGQVIDATPQQKPIAGVTVTILDIATGEITIVMTDKDGFYEKKGLPAGRYMLAVAKDGYSPWRGKSKVIAPDGEIFDRIKMKKEAAEVEKEDDVGGATIKGEVLEATPQLKPIAGVTVTIVNSATGIEHTVKTNKDGSYEKKGLPAGRYMISVSKPGYGDRVGKSKVVAEGGEVFDRIKMNKQENIFTFFKDLYGYLIISHFILFFLIFTGIE